MPTGLLLCFAALQQHRRRQVELGTIRSASGGRLNIQLDTTKHTCQFHPTWELRYLVGDAGNAVRTTLANVTPPHDLRTQLSPEREEFTYG